jgi:hypothetical protein
MLHDRRPAAELMPIKPPGGRIVHGTARSCGAVMSGPRLLLASLATWFGLLAIAVVNGAVREFVLAPQLGAAALPLSGVTAMAAFVVAIAMFVRATRPSLGAALRIGLLWLGLTLVAETLMTVAAGRPAVEVVVALGPAAVADGNLMAPLLVITTLAPVVFARLRG